MVVLLVCGIVGFLLGGLLGAAPFGPIGAVVGSLLGGLAGVAFAGLLLLFARHEDDDADKPGAAPMP